ELAEQQRQILRPHHQKGEHAENDDLVEAETWKHERLTPRARDYCARSPLVLWSRTCAGGGSCAGGVSGSLRPLRKPLMPLPRSSMRPEIRPGRLNSRNASAKTIRSGISPGICIERVLQTLKMAREGAPIRLPDDPRKSLPRRHLGTVVLRRWPCPRLGAARQWLARPGDREGPEP